MSDEYHAKLSPSGADGWVTCPGKITMEDSLPKSSSTYADEGTAAHTVAAWCLDEGTDAGAYAGRRVPIRPGVTVEVDDDMVEYVQQYVDSIRDFAGLNEISGQMEHELLVEVDVPIGHITGEEGATGRSDAIILTTDGELQVHDLKYGRGELVSPQENLQGLLYALGALEYAEVMGYSPLAVRIVIHQVRKVEAPQEWTLTIKELNEEWRPLFEKAARLAWLAWGFRDNWLGKEDQDQYLVPSEKGCRWCLAKATCPKARELVAKTVFSMSPATPEDFEDLTTLTPASTDGADPDWLSSSLKAVDYIEAWCTAVRAEVERRLLAGEPVPDFKLVGGRKGPRSWTDAEAAEELLKSKLRLKVDEMYTKKVITPTAAEKLLKGTPKRWEKVIPLVIQRDGKPSVAPASDPRPALDIKPIEDEFEDQSGITEDDLI
jgi:hypothetical protein